MLQRIDYYIKDHYGSKTGLKDLIWSKFQDMMGVWYSYENIEWKKVDSFVFLCKGNICRSPIAEAVAKKKQQNSRSCGLTAPKGDPADPRAILFAKKYDLNLEIHRTTPISEANFTESDLIVAMEPQHFTHMNFPSEVSSQKTLIGLWHPKKKPYLHDPYNTNDYFFDTCENFVIEATENMINIFNKNN